MHCDSPVGDGSDESKDGGDTASLDENSESQIPWKSPPSFASISSASNELPPDVVYKQLYQLRITQIKQGVDLSRLSRVQWGLSALKFSHHIVLKKSPWRDAEIPFIFRVTVCKSCCPSQDTTSTFLGVYGDQESALLVNDVHEILCGRCDKLSVLRKEDAMFFHHLTARTLDEVEGVLLPATPVLSVLEKLRIDSANAAVLAAAAIEEKKRKRSSTMDLLIESSLSLSMTSRDNSSSNGEGEEGDDDEADEDDIEGEEGDDHDESCMYSSSSTYRNHSPFSSFASCPSFSALKSDTPVTRSKSGCDSAKPTAHASAQHSSERDAERLHSLHLLALSGSHRSRKANRPRASTFSVVSSAPNHSNSQSLLDNEAERTPMGLVTWLASLEDDDFVAAKLLTEMSSTEKNDDSDPSTNAVKCDIPKFRGTRKSSPSPAASSGSASSSKECLVRNRERDGSGSEPPQRRRRANSVIEMTRVKCEISPAEECNIADHSSTGRTPRTYRKDPNWASEGRSRGYVGAYSPAERRRRIERFLEKRRLRVWQKNVKYDVRKNFADSRIRVKGRFVKKEDQAAMMLSMQLEARQRDILSTEMEEECGDGNEGKEDLHISRSEQCITDNNSNSSSGGEGDCDCEGEGEESRHSLEAIDESGAEEDEHDEYEERDLTCGDGDGDGDHDLGPTTGSEEEEEGCGIDSCRIGQAVRS